jgi:glutathione S-transferase
MLTLYHLRLCPFSRKIRLALTEKRMAFEMHTESVWERRDEFLALNPTGEIPVLIEESGVALSNSDAILEYLDEIQPDPPLYGISPLERAETRRLVYWFDRKFNIEVTENLVTEKIMKRFLGLGAPNSQVIRAGHTNIHIHLNYISYLVDRRNWLAGDNLTVADLAASAHLSAIDYIGDVPWNEYPAARDWYARIKSRLSFRPLLEDNIPGAPPAKHYRDLDF